MKELTILIPALNEEETIEIVVGKAKKWLENNKISGEVLVVNNGSTDNTKSIALKNGARVINIDKKGYGTAIINGIKESYGKYIIFADADDSYNLLEIDMFWEKLKSGYDMVIGNRYGFNMEKGAMKLTHKYIGTPILSYFIRKKYKVKIQDINCGLRAIKKEKFIELRL